MYFIFGKWRVIWETHKITFAEKYLIGFHYLMFILSHSFRIWVCSIFMRMMSKRNALGQNRKSLSDGQGEMQINPIRTFLVTSNLNFRLCFIRIFIPPQICTSYWYIHNLQHLDTSGLLHNLMDYLIQQLSKLMFSMRF